MLYPGEGEGRGGGHQCQTCRTSRVLTVDHGIVVMLPSFQGGKQAGMTAGTFEALLWPDGVVLL